MTLLERYCYGERDEVWAELRSTGERVREEPLFSEAQAVLREAMNRVRDNVQTIVGYLESEGYRFGTYQRDNTPFGEVEPHQDFSEAPLGMPAPDILERIEAFEAKFGAIPLSLRMFWEVVGSVNLVGHHPDFYYLNDPLLIGSVEELESVTSEEYFFDGCDIVGADLILAPGIYLKGDVADGDSFAMRIPNRCLDGKLEELHYGLSFLEYLRLCFRCGGFPGYSLDLKHRFSQPEIQRHKIPEPLQNLSASLKPI